MCLWLHVFESCVGWSKKKFDIASKRKEDKKIDIVYVHENIFTSHVCLAEFCSATASKMANFIPFTNARHYENIYKTSGKWDFFINSASNKSVRDDVKFAKNAHTLGDTKSHRDCWHVKCQWRWSVDGNMCDFIS